jgi:pSer/pThr/pTyr-binding forkhead associated (FHA) protein
VPDRPPLRLRPRNQHRLLACYCPVCGREPASDAALLCGYDGAMYQVAMLQVVPRHRPATTVYLDRPSMTIGRNDPTMAYYPEVDLSPSDPARHVSRRHATIERDGLRYRVTFHPSTNPSRLNGRPVAAGSTHDIAPGARLELGDLVATLIVRPVLDPTPDSTVTAAPAVSFGDPPAAPGLPDAAERDDRSTLPTGEVGEPARRTGNLEPEPAAEPEPSRAVGDGAAP